MLIEKFFKWLYKEEKPVPRNGMVAYRQGFKLEDNPFKQHTPEHSIWRDDWLFSAGRFK